MNFELLSEKGMLFEKEQDFEVAEFDCSKMQQQCE